MAKRQLAASGSFDTNGSAAAIRHLPTGSVSADDSISHVNCETPPGESTARQAISIMLAEKRASVIQRQREEIERHEMTSEDMRSRLVAVVEKNDRLSQEISALHEIVDYESGML
eukprot:8602228-Karenia_brevis.AAC.1